MQIKCIAQWSKSENPEEWTWRCNKYLMSRGVQFREDLEKCYHWKCVGRKPKPLRMVEIQEPTIKEPVVRRCLRESCKAPLSEGKIKYCSKTCQKRENDRAYRERKRAEKIKATEIKSGRKISIYLNAELLNKLESFCEENDQGKSKVIQDALSEMLNS